MSRITDPKGRVVPAVPKAIQAGNPHTSALEVGLSERVITTWYESLRQPVTAVFSRPSTAPSVDLIASFTDYTFAFKDGTWDDTYYQPFVMGQDADTVRVVLTVVAGSTLGGLSLWAESQTLSAPVTTVVGPMGTVAWGLGERLLNGPWWSSDPDDPINFVGNYLYRVDLSINTPDLTPGKGEIALVFKAQWRPTTEPVSATEQVNCNVRIFSVQAWNEIRNLRDA